LESDGGILPEASLLLYHQEMHLRPGWEPMEFICGENNADLPHLPGR